MSFKKCAGECGQIKNSEDFYSGRNKCKLCYKIPTSLTNLELAEYMNVLLTELRDDLTCKLNARMDALERKINDYQGATMVGFHSIIRSNKRLDEIVFNNENKIKLLEDNTEMIMQEIQQDKLTKTRNSKNLSISVPESSIIPQLSGFASKSVSPGIQARIKDYLSPAWHTDYRQFSGMAD